MRKAAIIPAIALMLVTGCSAADAEAEASAVSASPAVVLPSAAATVKDSEEGTCLKLLRTNGKGPLYSAIYIYKIRGGTTTFTSTPEGARKLADELQGITRNAPQDMVAALEILTSPAEGALQRAENSDAAFIAPTEAWQSAVGELLTRCAPYETSTADVAAADGSTAAYPGYPLVVNVGSLDYRVAAWFGDRLVEGQVVALAPGLYAPYDPNVPDLSTYYVAAGVAGDSAMKQTVFPGSGAAASWSELLPGAQEPQ